jgi:hypothetical protein
MPVIEMFVNSADAARTRKKGNSPVSLVTVGVGVADDTSRLPAGIPKGCGPSVPNTVIAAPRTARKTVAGILTSSLPHSRRWHRRKFGA